MLAGATIVDRCASTHAADDGRRDVFIDVNVVLEGSVQLGNRVSIGPTS